MRRQDHRSTQGQLKLSTSKPCRQCKGTLYRREVDYEYRGDDLQTWAYMWCAQCSRETHLFGYAVRMYSAVGNHNDRGDKITDPRKKEPAE